MDDATGVRGPELESWSDGEGLPWTEMSNPGCFRQAQEDLGLKVANPAPLPLVAPIGCAAP